MPDSVSQFHLKQNCIGLLLLGFISSPLPAGAADMQAEGFKFIRVKNYAKALDCFHAALQEQPNNWQIWQSMGNCQMQLGRNDAAITDLQKSIEIGGIHASQCTIMAAALEAQGQPKQALAWLKLACTADPASAGTPGMQAALMRLQDPQNNPTGSPAAPDYMAPLFKGWQQDAMPIRVFVRPNIQMPGFQDAFVEIVRDSLNQWCKATGNTVSYKLVNSAEAANVVFDYTEHRELVSSQHELGIDGNTEMLAKQDGTPGPTNVIILVKDHPGASKFRDRGIIAQCCLHEVGHALGMHGHSPNSHDVMFSTTLVSHTGLTERDKNTIRLMYKQRER